MRKIVANLILFIVTLFIILIIIWRFYNNITIQRDYGGTGRHAGLKTIVIFLFLKLSLFLTA